MRENLEANLARLSRLGYQGVELAVRNPELIDVTRVKGLLADNNLKAVALGTGQAYVDEGLSLSNPDPAIRRKATDRLKAHMELAAKLDCLVIVGLLRGRKSDSTLTPGVGKPPSAPQFLEWVAESLRECSEIRPGTIMVEPINRYETDIVNNLDEAAELCGMVGGGRVRILADTFHMNIEERDPVASLRKHAGLIGHMHFADSNRWAPGWGHIDFAACVKALAESGYKGFISVEILPKPTPETCAEESIKTLKMLDP